MFGFDGACSFGQVLGCLVFDWFWDFDVAGCLLILRAGLCLV